MFNGQIPLFFFYFFTKRISTNIITCSLWKKIFDLKDCMFGTLILTTHIYFWICTHYIDCKTWILVKCIQKIIQTSIMFIQVKNLWKIKAFYERKRDYSFFKTIARKKMNSQLSRLKKKIKKEFMTKTKSSWQKKKNVERL